MLRNQALATESFQSKWQMAGQEAHAFITRIRAQSEDFVHAELTAVQRIEDSLQRQHDGQLRSHADALQDECRDHVGQEEDKMRNQLQHALTQESVCVKTSCNKPYDIMHVRESIQPIRHGR